MDLCSAGCSSLVCLTVRRAEARISKRAVDQFIIPAQLEREHCEVEEVEARLTTSLPHQFTLELQEGRDSIVYHGGHQLITEL